MTMGIFDGFQFNPSSYGGQGGGLLDILRQFTQQQTMPSDGFEKGPSYTMPIGDYQMPVFGEQAAIPPKAQPTQQQAPQPQMQQQPEARNPFMAGLEGLISNAHTGPVGMVLGGVAGAAGLGGNRRNETVAALTARGIEPALAQQIARDPGLMRSVIPQLFGSRNAPSKVQEYQFAVKDGYKGSYTDFLALERAGGGDLSLNPVYGTDENGNTVLLQTSKTGQAVASKLPQGVKISTGVDKIDLGTRWGLVDKRSGQIVGYEAKDVAGAAAEKEVGTKQGEARVNLPATLFKAEQSLATLDKAINHPGRETATGLSGTLDPRNYIPGTAAKDFNVVAKQLEGKAFLEAFESLKGGGQITEVEGAKATQAMARLDRAQSDGEYLEALKELRGIIKTGIERSKQKAGVSTPAPAESGWQEISPGVRIREKR